MKVTQVSIGRFHHFHLARAMEQFGMLDSIWTGYPKFKLSDETGIPKEKIKTFPWIQGPYMALGRTGILNKDIVNKQMSWWAKETLDKHVARNIKGQTILVGLSGCSLRAGLKAKSLGGYYICDRGSSHIRYQNNILQEEYRRWNLPFHGVDPRIIEKEEKEYAAADKITVPSEFVLQSFVQMGVPREKLQKVAYGARLDRFKKVGDPPVDKFRILWVGAVSIRKGFLDLLEAFSQLKYKKKELVVVGAVSSEIKALLSKFDLNGVVFRGTIPNSELPIIYSTSHVFVLPSIEEGLAMVQGEALACGCPVVSTNHSGANDLFTDGKEGFIIPIRSTAEIANRLQRLMDSKLLRSDMSAAAMLKVKSLKGWSTYGDTFNQMLAFWNR